MIGFSIVLDTCTIYPAYLRDTLLRLAAAETYRPLWSAHILDELRRLLTNKIDVASADRILDAMTRHFPDALVTGYESLIPAMTNHPKDRHVLAAAVRSNADAIVTFNLDDFPATAAEPYEIDVLHPDAFLLNQIDLAPRRVLHTLDEQVAGYGPVPPWISTAWRAPSTRPAVPKLRRSFVGTSAQREPRPTESSCTTNMRRIRSRAAAGTGAAPRKDPSWRVGGVMRRRA